LTRRPGGHYGSLAPIPEGVPMLARPIDRFPRRMAYPGPARMLRGLIAADAEAARRNAPLDDVLGEFEERALALRRSRRAAFQRDLELQAEPERRGITRREFLTKGAAAGAALAVSATVLGAGRAEAAAPRIAIVGSGLAGVRCAHRLWTGGSRRYRSTIYEAATTHAGGRCWTLRNFFSHGLIGEHGGAFINHAQWNIRDLATSLGLRLEDVNGGELPRGKEVYRFDGAPYTYHDAKADWQDFGRDIFRSAMHRAPWPQLWNRHTAAGRHYDRLSVPEWLEESGIDPSSRFGRLMKATVVSEYGGDPGEQSSYNLISLLALGTALELAAYDERYHIVGGNDQLITRMLGRLPKGTLKQGHELVALAERGDGSYRLTFDLGHRRIDVVADEVVLALPFSTLRSVDLSKVRLSRRKRAAIQHMGMGQNAKIHVQVDRKTWPRLGYNGSTYTDWNRFCVAWDDSVPLGPHGRPAILLGFPGGSTGEDTLTGAAHGKAPARDVHWFLNQIEPIFPGTKAAWSGIAYEDHWSADPWHRGAYSYYRTGQYTTIAGIEQVPQGRIHFAGEHTDVNQQGFLEGAVVSGQRAAREILGRA
jgi:monoamine oxidase